jgi:DNA-binding MarR family transcriptional regulator
MRRLILHHFYSASIRKAWVHTLSTGGSEKNDAKLTAVCMSSHEELVKALQRDKGTISRSLRLLEVRGWIIIGRSPGGKAHHLTLTPEGHTRAAEVTKSWH